FNPEHGSPAEKAGVKEGDVIIAAGGHPVDQRSTLQRIIRGYQPGDVVDLEVMRYGQKKDIKVKLGEVTDDNTVASNDDNAPTAPSRNADAGSRTLDKLGLTVAPVSSDFASEAHLPSAYRSGLEVTHVAPSGPAYRNLFAPPDVIV